MRWHSYCCVRVALALPMAGASVLSHAWDLPVPVKHLPMHTVAVTPAEYTANACPYARDSSGDCNFVPFLACL